MSMTDDDKALVERLFAMADEYDSGHHESWPTIDALEIAAHRIEEMAARYEKSQDQIDRLIAENERIRERLGWICAVMDLDDDVSLQWIYAELEALRGLGDTK